MSESIRQFGDYSELLAWNAHPEEGFMQVADELCTGQYDPDPLMQIPYPKKNDRTRHYTVPTIRDELALTTLGTLLGPFFEHNMPSISFGNRMFRPKFQEWDTTSEQLQWKIGPYRIADSRFYNSYASSYGLFRRILQWLVNKGTGAPNNRVDEILQEEGLPYLSWAFPEGGHSLYSARLDVQTAYPSVKREILMEDILTFSQDTSLVPNRLREVGWNDLEPHINFRNQFGAMPLGNINPWHILADDKQLRKNLALSLTKVVSRLQYSPWQAPDGWDQSDLYEANYYQEDKNGSSDSRGIWGNVTPVSTKAMQEGRFGLPTGPLISGLLFNVYLTPVDIEAGKVIDSARQDGKTVAYLRYVDDIIILSDSEDSLFEMISTLRTSLESRGLRLNDEKTKPPSIKRWLSDSSVTSIDRKDVISSGAADTFTTRLVREMSDLAGMAFDEAFGVGSIHTIDQLFGLLAEGQQDFEVNEDSRIQFALNKLVQIPWPTTYADSTTFDHSFYVRLRSSIERALENAPWRISLWRPILIASVRMAGEVGTDKVADWLERRVLPNLRRVEEKESSVYCWESQTSPEKYLDRRESELPSSERVANRRFQHRKLRVSVHRAVFWREFSKILSELRNQRNLEFTPRWQLFVPDTSRDELTEWMGTIDWWIDQLYDNPKPDQNNSLWWWESEALAVVCLHCARPSEKLLKALGSPEPSRLRFYPLPSDFLEGLFQEDFSEFFSQAPFGSTLQPKNSGLRGRSELLWLPIMNTSKFSSIDSSSIWHALLPSDDTNSVLVCAGMQRLWGGYLVPEELLTRSKWPRLRHFSKHPWRDVLYLWTFESLRKLALSQGFTPRWGQFRDWFDWVELGPKGKNISLADIMNDESIPLSRYSLPGSLSAAVGFNCYRAMLKDERHIVGPNALVLTKSSASSLETLNKTAATSDEQLKKQLIEAIQWINAPQSIKTRRPSVSDPAPHPIFLLPGTMRQFQKPPSREYAAFLAGSVIIWASTPDDRILDSIARLAPLHRPIVDRTALKSSLMLPENVWQWIDEALCSPYDNADPPAVQSASHLPTVTFVPGGFNVDSKDSKPTSALNDNLEVYIEQLSERWDFGNAFATGEIRYRQQDLVRLSNDIATRLNAARLRKANWRDLGIGKPPDLLVFPELTLPRQWKRELERFTQETGIGVIGGMLPPEPNIVDSKQTRYYVNEAIAILPLPGAPQKRDLSQSYWPCVSFLIPKPAPSVIEEAFLAKLMDTGKEWIFQRRRQWQIFVHPSWGSFSIGVCSDLLATEPWNWLKGKIQHFFLPSLNSDIDLFDQFSWTRAYEMYANIVVANHGSYGGSVAWTPYSGFEKERVRIHGRPHGVTLRVALPVSSLFQRQSSGNNYDISRWKDKLDGKTSLTPKWKPLPPDYLP